MEDLRLILVVEVCEQFGFQLFPDRCTSCGFPLVEKLYQCIPFCWFCACDKKTAMLGRAALLKARLANQGIFLEERREIRQEHPEMYEPRGPFKFGMPL